MPGTHGYSADDEVKDAYAKRLRRIEGQVRGIARMIDEDKYCIDILTQISAVNSALRSVALGLLDEHMRHCVSGRPPTAVPRPTPNWRRRLRRLPDWFAPEPDTVAPASGSTLTSRPP